MRNKYIHEVKYHIFRRWPYFLCFFAVVFLCACRETEGIGHWQKEYSVTDVLICTLKGCVPYNSGTKEAFFVPVFYFLIGFMYIIFIVYGCGREKNYEKIIFVKYHSRENWWTYKTLWNITCALCFTAITWAAVAAATYVTGGGGMKLHENVWKFMEAEGCRGTLSQVYFYCLILRFAVLAAFGEIVLCLQMMMAEYFAVIVPIAILVISAYDNVFCLGYYLMTLRSGIFVQDGVTTFSGIFQSAVIFTGTYLLGRFLVKRKDIII